MILTEIGEAVASVAASVGPSVVGLGGRWGMGSGVLLEDGLILTNAHNVSPERATVTLFDGRVEHARVLGIDVDADLALLEVSNGEAGPITWQPDEVAPAIGAPVVGLANPGGAGSERLWAGSLPPIGRSAGPEADGWPVDSSTRPLPLPGHRVALWSIWTGCWWGSTPAAWAGGSIWRRPLPAT